jgi:hypothetical protein
LKGRGDPSEHQAFQLLPLYLTALQSKNRGEVNLGAAGKLGLVHSPGFPHSRHILAEWFSLGADIEGWCYCHGGGRVGTPVAE